MTKVCIILFELNKAPDDMKRVTISLFILPHPRKNMDLHWWGKNNVKNCCKNSAINNGNDQSLGQQFLYFLHSPFVPTNTRLAEILQKSSETRLHVFQRKSNLKRLDVKIGSCELILTETTQSYEYCLTIFLKFWSWRSQQYTYSNNKYFSAATVI